MWATPFAILGTARRAFHRAFRRADLVHPSGGRPRLLRPATHPSTSYNGALRQLANRLVGILHGCLTTGSLYDGTTAWSHHLNEATP